MRDRSSKGRRPGRTPIVFLDANVLFSAAYSPEGRSAALFALARKRLCRLITTRYAIEEARRNLALKKQTVLSHLENLLNWVQTCPEADQKRLDLAGAFGLTDPMDVPILAAAFERADILVTGDRKHFGPWMKRDVQGLIILSLAQTLDVLLSRGKREAAW